MDSASGWPLGLEPVHFRRRVLDTLTGAAGMAQTKISTSSSDGTSNLETESTSSSKFFPQDKPVTLGEILGMSLNHLATNSFRSIELHVLDSSQKGSKRRWSLMRCTCTKAYTSSSRFDEESMSRSISDAVGKVYNNSIFEEQPDRASNQNAVSLLDHFRNSPTTENPLFLLDYGDLGGWELPVQNSSSQGLHQLTPCEWISILSS